MTTPPNPQGNPISPYTPQTPAPKRKTDPIVTVIAVVALILAIVFFFADIPPVPQLINFQADVFGNSYYVKLTILVTWVIFALPAIGIYKLVTMNKNKN